MRDEGQALFGSAEVGSQCLRHRTKMGKESLLALLRSPIPGLGVVIQDELAGSQIRVEGIGNRVEILGLDGGGFKAIPNAFERQVIGIVNSRRLGMLDSGEPFLFGRCNDLSVDEQCRCRLVID